MNTRISVVLGFAGLVAGGIVGCKSDPTASGVGTPSRIIVDLRALVMNIGTSAAMSAKVVDNRLTPLVANISFTSCDASTATVTPTPFPGPQTSAHETIAGVGLNSTCILTSSPGLKSDTTVVAVLPTTFAGTVSSATPKGGDTLTLNATATTKFTPESTTVTFGGPEVGTIVSATADVIKVLVPFSSSAALTITNVAPTYVPVHLTLSTPSNVKQTGDFWSASGSWQTAPDISGILPATGSTSAMIVHMSTANSSVCPEVALGFGSEGPCAMFKFTLADTATYNFTTDWEGGTGTNPDVDIYVCSDTTVAKFGTGGCFESGTAGATGAKPQSIGDFKYPAGSHWFVIENFCSGDPKEINCTGSPSNNHFVTISRP